MTESGTINLDEKMENELQYAGVALRVKASVCDSFVMIGLMVAVTYFFSIFENVPENARILAFVFIFGLYDPIFTSLFGGTIGHMIMGVRVKKRSNPQKNVFFPLTIIRYIVKVVLGIISLLTVGNNKNNMALHDLIVNSIVIIKI